MEIRRIENGKSQFSNCEMTLGFSSSYIDHDYDNIEDDSKRMEEQLKSMKSDLSYLADFSFLRKSGYYLLGFGFILQFVSMI